MSADKRHSIETRQLNLWYGDFQALINVSVKIVDGLITGLIGPSGCGKTTLLRCFNRVNERYGNVTTTGEVKILGKNIYDADVSLPELRKKRRHGISTSKSLTNLHLRKYYFRSACPLRTSYAEEVGN
jgi:ABC-type phosphate transport system ATPase subunit